MVKSIQRWREQGGPSCRRLLAAAGLPRSSFLRWQRRLRNGQAAIQAANRRNIQELEKQSPTTAAEIQRKIAALSHGRHRSRGAPALCQEIRHVLSRRSFQILVRERRHEVWRERQAAFTRISWSQPAAVWAMDPGQQDGRHWNLVSDLASRFRFDLFAAARLPARSITDQLAQLFAQSKDVPCAEAGAAHHHKVDVGAGGGFAAGIGAEQQGVFGVVLFQQQPDRSFQFRVRKGSHKHTSCVLF